MSYDEKAIKTLSESIQKAINLALESAPFDKTADGRITALLEGGYSVRVNGENYKVKAYGDFEYEIDEVVKVVIPQNNFNKMFIIPKDRS